MRLNLEINEEQMASLKALQEHTGAVTMKDLVNNALSVLDWVVEEIGSGNEIAAVNENRRTYRVLVSPLLKRVKDRTKQRYPPRTEAGGMTNERLPESTVQQTV